MDSIIKIVSEHIIIYYHKKLKYPVLVIEIFKDEPYNSGIKRINMGEPFGQDPRIPAKYQHTTEDYISCSKRGYSYGHNAAAFIHKSSVEDYKSTYLYSNICPQEIVFNSGLWLLFEIVSERILKKYKNGIILNGSIRGKDRSFNNRIMNIPYAMYKIILYTDKANPSRSYYTLFIATNEPHYMDQKLSAYPKTNYSLLSYTMDIKEFQKKYRISGDFGQYVRNDDEAYIFTDSTRIQQMRNSTLYGNIIYAKTRNELDIVVPDPSKLSPFHTIYYEYKLESLRKDRNANRMNELLNRSLARTPF